MGHGCDYYDGSGGGGGRGRGAGRDPSPDYRGGYDPYEGGKGGGGGGRGGPYGSSPMHAEQPGGGGLHSSQSAAAFTSGMPRAPSVGQFGNHMKKTDSMAFLEVFLQDAAAEAESNALRGPGGPSREGSLGHFGHLGSNNSFSGAVSAGGFSREGSFSRGREDAGMPLEDEGEGSGGGGSRPRRRWAGGGAVAPATRRGAA